MKSLLTLALVAGLAPLAFAEDGNTSSATAQASVTILAPVKVTTTGSLQFGKVVVSAFPSNITIDSTAHVTPDQNASIYVTPGATSVPYFTITKDATASVTVLFKSNFSPEATFTLDPAVITGAEGFATSAQTAYENKPLYGVLTLPTGTVPGVINGTITITATYA
jgi:hypothetical protein